MRLTAACVCTVVAWPYAALADRAVGRTARLDAGTIELGLGMERSGRATTLDSATESLDADSSQVSAVPRVRGWLTDWLDLELRLPFSVMRALEVDGTSEEVEDAGLLDAELRTSAVLEHGPLLWGGAVAAVFPTAQKGFGTDRTAVTATLLGGWRLPGGVLHVAPAYTLREGDSYTDAGDTVSLEVGYEHRLGSLSLAPTASIERTLPMRVNDVEIEGAFTTWRIGGVVAAELVEDMTAALSVQGAWAGEHDIAGDERVAARELLVVAQLTYAWDLWTPRSQAVSARDPAAIHVNDLRVDGLPATAQQLNEIRHLVPRLRLATLTAEHDAGGASGAIRVLATGGAAPGVPWRVDVQDAIGQPRLSAAIADFFRDSFPHWARSARTVELQLCFDRCPGPPGR